MLMSNCDDYHIPDYVSVTKMAEMLNLSRSRFYQLIDEGILLKPAYLVSNKRPVYTRKMAMRNLEVKKNNLGINGKVIIFYSSRDRNINSAPMKKNKTNKSQEQIPESKYQDMIDALESLGLGDVSDAQISSAIDKCFPDGTENIDADEILKSVFRLIRVQNSEHKPRT